MKKSILSVETFASMQKENILLRQIIDHIFEGVLATDEEGRILFFNPVVAKNDGLTPAAIGKTENEVYQDADYDFPEIATKKVLKTGKPIIEQRYSYNALRGNRIHMIYSCYPFIYEGKILGSYTIGRAINQINHFINETLALEKYVSAEENKNQGDAYYFLENIIGDSASMRECVELARKTAQYDMPVMIVGETGTGKEMFAQGIHNGGKTARGSFVSINCAAVPETLLESILFGTTKGSFTGATDTPGLFEQAEDGSILLDEVNSMPLALQSKLLRVLQEKKVRRLGGKTEISINCRIISTSNEDPFDAAASHAQQIRTDLLFRLAAAAIYVPPLRKRKQDIQALCRHFMRKNSRSKSIYLWEISPQLLDLFHQYDWPGNVRELQNIIANAVLYAGPQERFLQVEHIPPHLRRRFGELGETPTLAASDGGLRGAVAEFERKVIIETVLKYNGNISKAAEALKMTRQNLYYKMKKLHLDELLARASHSGESRL